MTNPNHVVIVGGTDDQWVIGDAGKSTVSFDGGLSWSSINQFATHDIVGVDFYDDLHGYCVGGVNSLYYWTGFTPMGSIWYTNNGGMTWSFVDSSYNDQLKDLFIVNDSLAYAAGNNGYILKNTAHLSTLGILENDNELNIIMKPNPVRDILSIQFNNKHNHALTISILDITGRLIKSFELPRNENDLKFDTEFMEGGIYFIRIGDERISETRKIIKIK